MNLAECISYTKEDRHTLTQGIMKALEEVSGPLTFVSHEEQPASTGLWTGTIRGTRANATWFDEMEGVTSGIRTVD